MVDKVKIFEVIGEKPSNHLITLKETDTVRDALKILSGNKIISAPVACGNGFRMVDLLDIALNLVKTNADVSAFDLPVSSVCNESGINLYIEVGCNMFLSEAVGMMGSWGVQRLIVKDIYDKPSSILSQMDVVRWLNDHHDMLPKEFWNTWAGNLIPVDEVVFTIREEESMMSALQKISLRRYTGAAVIDSRGALVCNFSVSDLGPLSFEKTTDYLKLSVKDYMIQTKKVPKQVVSCTKDSRVGDVIKTLVKEHIHHVFITEPRCPYSDVFSQIPFAIFSTNNIVVYFDKYLRGFSESSS